jgi:hypothetical protein
MVFVPEPREGIDLKSPIRHALKSHFLDLNEKEVENVNKGSQRISNDVKLWVKNAFDEWNFFCNLDTTRSIVDLSKDEYSFQDLVDMFSFFILKIAKKDSILYPPTK